MDSILYKMRRAIDVRSAQGPAVQDVRSSILTMKTYKYVLFLVGLVALYYLLLASDLYVTRAQVYVKSTGASAAVVPQLQFLGGAAPDSKDTAMVVAYAGSHEMLKILEEKIGFADHFASGDWDYFSRMSTSPSEEGKLKYFRSRLQANLHPETGIISIKAQGYTREMSLKMVQEAITGAENFINSVGQKLAIQEIAFVEKEMERSYGNLQAVRAKLMHFQNENGILSAEASGAARQAMVDEMENELVRMRTREKTLASYLNPAAADLVAARDSIDALEAQLDIEHGKLAGQQTGSANDISATYQALKLELEFATELYQSSLISLERSRVESYKKLKHLVVVETPQLADEALEPRKLYNIVSLFVALTLAYGIISMVIATIREHRDV